MSDRYIVPRRLDDPELIGFWTLDEFAGMIVPFTWGILGQHVFIGIALAAASWFALRKAKAGRSWASSSGGLSVRVVVDRFEGIGRGGLVEQAHFLAYTGHHVVDAKNIVAAVDDRLLGAG